VDLNLEKYKSNPKTAYLADTLARLLEEEVEIKSLLETDPSMKQLSEEELTNIAEQKTMLIKQMDEIIEAEEEEESNLDGINEIILEVRAGAGGERE